MPSQIFRPDLLDDKIVLLTGGGTGLGRATALELTALGARVVIAGRRQEPLDETAAMCEGGRCEAIACDIREEDQVEALVDRVLQRHGRIDTLVNNAGGQYMTPAEDISPKGFRTVVRVNLEGTWLMTHAVATKAMMPESRGGKIVNVTLSPHHGLPGMAHSSAARAAVENMTRVLSIEWARFGIRLNAIASGHFETEAIEKYPEPVRAGVARTVPLQRLGRPEEQAWLVAFLASPAGDYYSGSIITIDGARDNWFGPWPPPGLSDEAGKPLAEERRPKT
ncbi:MAG TPA: SDR family oxidoreductase [Thermoleophilaceae bacterium]